MIDTGKDDKNNGGYNYFEALVDNYLTIRKEVSLEVGEDPKYYKIEKRVIFNKFVLLGIYRFYIKRNRGNFKIDRGWEIIRKHYAKEPYFYTGLLFSLPIMILKRMFKRLTNK